MEEGRGCCKETDEGHELYLQKFCTVIFIHQTWTARKLEIHSEI